MKTTKKPFKVIILAAGLGNRISAAASGIPKPLLPLNGQPGSTTFLDRHIDCFEKCGVKEIFLIGNSVTYGAEVRSKTAKIEWILNPTLDLSQSGSGHSAWYAFHHKPQILDGHSRVVLMDADIVYDFRLMKEFLETDSNTGSKNLIYPRFEETSEEVLVFSKNELPSLIGKGLQDTPLSKNLKCLGEATGIMIWEPQDHSKLLEVTNWLVKYSTTKARIEHEDISQRMMSIESVSAILANVNYPFMEVDTPEEYQTLIDQLYPKLQ